MTPLDAAGFDRLRAQVDVVPFYRAVRADTITPVAAFAALSDDPAAGEGAFLLESVERGTALGRYSFAGAGPRRVRALRKGEPDCAGTLRRELAPLRVYGEAALPPFFGGAVGWLGFGAARWSEELPDRHGEEGRIDAELLVFDRVIAFDHLQQKLFVIASAFTSDPRPAEEIVSEAEDALETMLGRLRRAEVDLAPAGDEEELLLEPLTDETSFLEAVGRVRAEIGAGEIFQAVLSQRWSASYPASEALALYRALRSVNPSPYMVLLRTPTRTLVGASPEMLVRVRDGRVEARPIAGTRRRGATAAEDLELERELVADEKENAEHLMLLDLGRNDVGRVSAAGSVLVREFCRVERYSHVMHLVSSVEGRLREGMTAADALLASFPAGTVSGAPKLRAMEIIDELEPLRRDSYAGAILYAGFSGSLDSCIAIRTFVLQDDRAFIQAGAGIVWDSDPAREHDECARKAAALARALRIATASIAKEEVAR